MLDKQKGSVFFYILIGIVLLAAVIAAVTSSVRLSSGSMDMASEEKMNLALSELRNTALESRTAIQSMVSEGFAPDQIDASASGPEGDYYQWTNSLCTSTRCKLYDPAGGGLKFFLFSKAYPQLSAVPNDVIFSSYPQGLFWTWWAYKGSLKGDIIYRVRITKAFCNYINKKNGITADIDSVTPSMLGTTFQLGGAFSALSVSHYYSFAGEGEVAYLFGKDDGCFLKGGTPNEYIYVAFVYAR